MINGPPGNAFHKFCHQHSEALAYEMIGRAYFTASPQTTSGVFGMTDENRRAREFVLSAASNRMSAFGVTFLLDIF